MQTYGKKWRVIFKFFCPNNCKPHRVFYNDGIEYRIKGCKKCGSFDLIEEAVKDGEEIIASITRCSHCDFQDIFELDKTEVDPDFPADRLKYSMDRKEIIAYQRWKDALELIGAAKLKDVSK